MKKRTQIPEKYKWDLTSVIKDDAEIEQIFKIMEKMTTILPKYKDKLNNPDILYERLTKYEKEFIQINKLAYFLSNMKNTDASNVKILEYIQKFINLETKLDQANAFFVPQLYKLEDNYLKSLLLDKRFKDYDNMIRDIIKLKPHKIDEKTNEILSKMGSFLGDNENIHSILRDAEIRYEDIVDSKGKIHKLDTANYSSFLHSKDPQLRKNAFNSMMQAYGNLNKTLTELYLKDIELDKFSCSISNYNSVLERELIENDVPRAVFDNIVKYTNENIPLLQEFLKTQARISKNKNFSYYDLFEERSNKTKYTIEQAQEIMLEALSPLGNEYIGLVKKKLNDKSIDYLPNENKYTGAYNSHCYGAKIVILMNFKDNYNSLSTLVHEMGHCINAEYFLMAQPQQKADITIFAAEIASTVNEILLSQYLLKNATKREKIYYLQQFLDNVRSTIYRQTLFTEFELFAHQKIENEENITYKDLNECYTKLNKKYYGNSCKIPKSMQYEWSLVPHFYSAYYVYTYATGMVTAITLATRILNEPDFYKKYIYFLKNGTNKPSIDVLKEIGIDLTQEEPYKIAFDYIKRQLNDYKSLCK